MLAGYFFDCSVKGPAPTEPLVNDNPQCILVAGDPWSASHLFRCRVENGTLELLYFLYPVAHVLRDNGNSKSLSVDLVIRSKQHIMWLDIPVNQALIVDVLKSLGYLLDIRCNRRNWQPCASRVTLA